MHRSPRKSSDRLAPARPVPRIPRWAAGLFFGVWLCSAAAGASWLATSRQRSAAATSLPAEIVAQTASAVYVLGSDCGLSFGIAGQLVAARPASGLREEVWLATPEPELEAQLRAAGYDVRRVDLSAVPREMKVRTSPWLVLRDAGQHTVYSDFYPAQWRGPAKSPDRGSASDFL